MTVAQRYPTRQAQAEAVLEAVLADPAAVIAELVRRGDLVAPRPGVYTLAVR